MTARGRMVLSLLLLLTVVWWWSRSPEFTPVVPHPPELVRPPERLPIGNEILAHYADPATPPREDLTWMSRALENFSLMVKGVQPLPLGANEEIAKALRGKNAAKLVFLRAPCPALNGAGQLIDRWGTPLYFHAEAADHLDIRSAGPDREMWTADDFHRDHNGHFRTAEELLPESLFTPSGLRRR